MKESKVTLTSLAKAGLLSRGGEANLNDIYESIEEMAFIFKYDLYSNPNWQAAVRREIQTHSPDSKCWNGKDVFFASSDGLGAGKWKLLSL